MRKRLERFLGQRIVVRAIFRLFGKKKLSTGRIVRYMLLEDIRDSNNRQLTAHMWIQLGKDEVITTPMQQSDTIQFTALVEKYAKGNAKRPTFDYGLIKPRDIQVISQEETVKQELNKRPAWQVIRDLRPMPRPIKQEEPWPRLFKAEYNLSNLKTRTNSIQAQIMRKEKQNIYGVQFDTGFVATSDGYTYETLTDFTNMLEQRGEYTLTWQDEEVQES